MKGSPSDAGTRTAPLRTGSPPSAPRKRTVRPASPAPRSSVTVPPVVVRAARSGRHPPAVRTSAVTAAPATGSPAALTTTPRRTFPRRCTRIRRGGRLPSIRTPASTASIWLRFHSEGATGPAGPWTR